MSMIDGAMPSKISLGILAGGGSVPEEVAQAAVARGYRVHVVAIDGEADGRFPGAAVTPVDWGQIGRMLRTFRDAQVTHLVIVGRVSRPDLTRIKPDFGLVRALPHIFRILRSGGDDGVLRGVVRFFEGHGLTVIGPADVAPDLVASVAAAGVERPSVADELDIAKGLDIVGVLGPFDVGQSVVVRDGIVVAIEGAEGTDRMLARVTGSSQERRGVLVKRPKPQQDMRVDMPAIGPDTVSNAVRSGLRGIAVLRGQVLLTQREEMVRRANADRVFVAGVEDRAVGATGARAAAIGRGDVERGSNIIDVLGAHIASRCVVVAGKYVLAIETGEGIEAVLKRVANLRQWGSHRVRKRVGYAVFAAGEPIDANSVDLAASAGLKGLAIVGTAPVAEVVRARARDASVQLVRVSSGQEQPA